MAKTYNTINSTISSEAMNDSQFHFKWKTEYSTRGSAKYICEVWHKGLNDYRYLSSSDKDVLDNKIRAHNAKLEEKWIAYKGKRNLLNSKESNFREAEQRSKSAKDALKAMEELLIFTLEIDDAINWDTLFDRSPYEPKNPADYLNNGISSIPKPVKDPFQILSEAPDRLAKKYDPKLDFFDKLIPFIAKDKIKRAEYLYESDIASWQEKTENAKRSNEKIDQTYEKELLKYEAQVNELRENVKVDSKQWAIDKAIYEDKQKSYNRKVELLKADYMAGKPTAIVEACEIVLSNSLYPDFISKNFEIEYIPDSKILVVDFSLPAPDQIPTLSDVKFIKGEFKEYHISDTQSAKNFDSVVYKITLRTLHELFEADQTNGIDAISFNGWVDSIDKSTGKRVNNCIVSIQAKRDEFMQIDLQHVDPKACFKALKGVGSSKLAGLTAIQPILRIDKNDKRFVDHYYVADSIDDSTNIASMGWEDFEHLIREVFAKEFNQNGGEVKVTQASKDGGVDAIAFDPDPIRGGKIVIQAKRYTNTVGVSAVRDLYGTVMNEGATKGILVTTADYGPDAYAFSKGKPITLMNGANLLYLLDKHGHKARIDIKEAKLLSKNI